MSQRLAVVFVAASLVLGACGDDDGGGDDEADTGTVKDAAVDSTVRNDATVDATVKDAVVDAVVPPADTGVPEDAKVDQLDAQADAQIDSGSDAATDAGHDAGHDAGRDAGTTPVRLAVAGQIVITELQAAPAGYVNDNLAEWVEIFNPSTTVSYELGGCSFGDKAGDADFVFAEGTVIAPLAYLTLSSATFTTAANGFVSDVVYGTMSGLSGTADGPNIKCGQVVIDAVNYAVAQGFPVPDGNMGHTLQLSSSKLSATDNDVGANWCFSANVFFTTPAPGSIANYGSPKAANAACPQ